MNTIVELQGVSYWYPDTDKAAIADVNLKIAKGEFLLITGSSGSGKSTICRCINGIVPKFMGGKFKGRIIVNGMDMINTPVHEIAKYVGMVFQDPENQIVMNTVENEIAFGLENMLLKQDAIEKRIHEILEYMGISDLRYRKTGELSGGEKQKIVIASVLAMQPRIIVLDEPLSQLDPESAKWVLKLIRRLNKELGITIIIAEHRTGDISADRIFDMDKKRYVASNKAVKNSNPCNKIEKNNNSGIVAIDVENLSFSYNSGVLKDVNLRIHAGEFVAISGHNGSGKTTLVKHFNGLLKPEKGRVRILGRETGKCKVEELAKIVGYVPQNPNELLFSDTVIDELKFTLKNLKVYGNPEELLDKLNLSCFKLSCPRDLSGGQKQRVAIASVVVANQKILILDEPTRGMDLESRKRLLELLKKLHNERRTIILVTHDMELSEAAERVMVLRNGRILL